MSAQSIALSEVPLSYDERVVRAENGCFIKTRPTRRERSQWVNMVANFNLTWKATCVEILNYVCFLSRFVISSSDRPNQSSPNVPLARGLKRGEPQLSGGSGQERPMTLVQTVNGLAVKLQKPRIISLTGEHTMFG